MRKVFDLLHIRTVPYKGGGVVAKNLIDMCRPGFQSPELIFWLENGGLRNEFFAKIGVSGAKNWQKLVLKSAMIFFPKNASGISGAGKRLEMVGLQS